MKFVKPRVELIAATEIKAKGLRAYLDDIGAQEFELDPELSGADALTLVAGKACYKSFVPGLNPNVKKVRDDPTEYIQNMLA